MTDPDLAVDRTARQIWLAGLTATVLLALLAPLGLIAGIAGEVPGWFRVMTSWVLIYPLVVVAVVAAGLGKSEPQRTGAALTALAVLGWALLSTVVQFTA